VRRYHRRTVTALENPGAPTERPQGDATVAPADASGRVLTGFRPTGPLHIGHWFGNVTNAVRLQDSHETFYFIADWHMLTTHYDRTDELPGFVRTIATELVAAGVDPARSTFYLQSDVKEVAELQLLLGMISPLGWLERVPTYKERLRDMAERDVSNFGLLGYPVLQTVDITIVKGELVPVGEDQVVHIELAREVVRRFNRLYGDVLLEPQPLLSEAPLIPGSDGRKMSKSLDNTIGVRDEPDAIRAAVRSFVTDPQKIRLGDPGRPEICPVFALHKLFSQDIVEWTEENCRTGALGCVRCKQNLADRVIEYYRPFRERRAQLEAESGLVRRVLEDGAAKVRPVVQETMKAVRSAMSFA
jgi:tryptophanyl-tRNA synthetase